jgi:membrane fusion protein (multidrug efflux system)
VADQDQNQNSGEQTAEIHGTVQIKQPQGGEQGQGGEQKKGADQGAGKSDDKKDEKKPEDSPAKKSRRKFIIIGVLLVLILGAAFFYWRSTFTEDTDDAQVDGNLYQVSARVAGQVTKVYVNENEMVKAGQPIADLDARDLQVAVEQAQANLANAQADAVQARSNVPITSVNVRTSVSTSGSDVLSAQAGVLNAEQQVAAAAARIAQAEAAAAKSASDVERYTPLVQRDVISKQMYDGAVAQAASDQAAVVEARKNEDAEKQMVRVQQQKVAQAHDQAQQSMQNAGDQVRAEQARSDAAEASVKQAQAKLDEANLNLSYGKILSPVDGIVSKKSVSVGDNLSVGQTLLTIVPLTNLWVTANFKETQLKEMKQGQEVDLSVDALGGRHFTGKLTQIGGATGSMLSLFPPENATGNYVKVVQRIPVRIDFTNLNKENQDEALRPGMSVEPSVHIK